MILRIEFIDTETITMYKKLRCERHIYIFYGILNMDEQPDFKEMLLLNPHHFINMCK